MALGEASASRPLCALIRDYTDMPAELLHTCEKAESCSQEGPNGRSPTGHVRSALVMMLVVP